MMITAAQKELQQPDDLVNPNSLLFKHARWKVLFSDNFRRSFRKLKSSRTKNLVLNLLLKLAGGWRPKNKSVELRCESSSQILKQFKVDGLYVICTIDIIKEFSYVQVFKVWDVLPLDEIPKLKKRLDNIFATYADDYINRCTEKYLEGKLEVPGSWATSEEMIRFRDLRNCEGDEVNVKPGDGRSYVENSKVSESLLLMKFYPLSSGVVNHLLSGRELDLPMQATDEQMDLISFRKSSFIIGRSGTGKTTILTMKLFQNEQSFRVASEGCYEGDSNKARYVEVLRQLFVTVSPKLCYAVKQHVSHLACDGNSTAEIDLDDASELPDTFVGIPDKNYPLVITFHKFLMMLDGTLGTSFFERFKEARVVSLGSTHRSSRSIALQAFIRSKEVTFEMFCSIYWPRFNTKLTKKLDASRVFTEIITHIKGGLQAGETHNGTLSYEGYSLLSEGRASTLTKQDRDAIYNLFQAYERMKSERGEFDLGDLVNHIHHRLRNGKYEGDQMHFVYIDEVQDLSMRHISLFKYVCQNVDEGFVFAGDTAQTIARGIDFRFQDIRSLFYKEFISNGTGKQEKGLVSEIFQLKQNFRTHAGVLELAQSVIEILYCYFAHSIDLLEPETSLIYGEVPLLLESGSDENVVGIIFAGSESGGQIVGFGAEQVILVRDDCAKVEICEYVGNHALVLTILECKGLEFQDVLLYNFFGSSPLNDQWRVIYGYMKERGLLDGELPQSFPSFSEARHNVLCSELKQLYVAITRTRQRLWICESKDEICKPMFNYWKRRGLVQVRKLDDSVAQAMQVASSPEEWRERGKKLFYEDNFEMATMCFERAGDTMWEKMAKASGLRTSAAQMRGAHPEAALGYLREAGEMFESIGKLESAATCYYDSGDYKRAGKIYLDKCGQVIKAAECFMLAGCYIEAAEAYAKGHEFSNCLTVCQKGKLFDKGLQYVQNWREYVDARGIEIEKIEQDFLESCALDYHRHKDHKSMMKFVRAFCSMDSKRAFLRSLNCLDDLLLLEEESGNFLDAAELARSLGNVLKEADLLGKAGFRVEAASLILWYVFANSLWGNGSRGWPLKQFPQKEELCKQAESLAKMESGIFYGFVCNELKILSARQSSLSELQKYLHDSQQHKSLRGEILSIRKILDGHLHLDSSKYDWEDELPVDIKKHSEDKIFQNQVSIRTLIYYWNWWKCNIVDIFQSLGSLKDQATSKHESHVDFGLNYFGVRKQSVKANMVYLIVNKDADWARNANREVVCGDGKLLTLDGWQLANAIRSYWQSELLSVGVRVLETLDSLHKLKSNGSAFHRGTALLHVFEVSKFLLDCKHLNLTVAYRKTLQDFLAISTTYFDLVFPLDGRESISEHLVSLRETGLSLNLLEEIILQDVNIKGDLPYRAIGKVVMILLGSRKPAALYEKILKGLEWNPSWKSFVEIFWHGGFENVDVAPALQSALVDAYNANWRVHGYISPHSFVHLLECLHLMVSISFGTFYTTKSSFVGCFTHLCSASIPSTAFAPSRLIFWKNFVRFFVEIVQEILYKKHDTVSWIEKSNIHSSHYHPLLVLKLLMIICSICLQSPDCSPVLHDLLVGRGNIAYLLPKKFVFDLLRRRRGRYLNLNPDVVAEAFKSIGDPLLIVSFEKASRIHAPCAIFVELMRPREEIMSVLFPRAPISQASSTNGGGGRISEVPSSSIVSDAKPNVNPLDGCKVEMQTNRRIVEDIRDAINGETGEALSTLPIAATKKADADGQPCSVKDATVLVEANTLLDDRKLLSSAFHRSQHQAEQASGSYETKPGKEVVEGLEISRPMIDDVWNQSVTSQESDVEKVVPESSHTAETHQEDDHVHETDDEHRDDDDPLQAKEASEKQSSGGDVRDAKTKKGNRKKGMRWKISIVSSLFGVSFSLVVNSM